MTDATDDPEFPTPEQTTPLGRPGLLRRFWWIGAAILAVAAAVTALLLMRPGRAAITLNANRPAYLHPDGLAVSLADISAVARVKVETIARETFVSGQAGAGWVQALEALPPAVTPLSPLYTIRIPPDAPIIAEMAVPNGAEPLALLDLYAWDEMRQQWVFVPSQQEAARGVIVFKPTGPLMTVMAAHTDPRNIRTAVVISVEGASISSSYDLALPEGVWVTETGGLSGAPLEAAAPSVMPIVANRSGALSDYSTEQARYMLVESLMGLIMPYDGLVLDFAPGNEYATLVADLAERIHAHGKELHIVVRGTDTTGYEIPAIAGAVDRVWLAPGDDPTAYLPGGPVSDLLGQTVGQVQRSRLGLLISVLNVDIAGGTALPIDPAAAAALFGTVEVAGDFDPSIPLAPGSSLPLRLSGRVESMGLDAALAMNYLTYRDDSGQMHTVYFSSPQNLARRAGWARYYGLESVAVYGLAHPDAPPGAADALAAILDQQPVSDPDALQIVWRVTSESGASVAETGGDLSLIQYLWQAVAEPGSYAISAAISGPAPEASRGEVVVQVAEAAPAGMTPTPTATPSNRPTATLDPNATPAPQPTPAPVAGSIAPGQFELGGQTQSFGHAAQMAAAGMTWVKFQHKWSPGDDPSGAVGGRIADAHARGFKVLLSIPGAENPASIDYAAYVNFLTGVAALGPDAIEVWNEMNLPREWPLADINGATYVTNMLAPAYQAIKAVNPNILVISGAPAPTGVYGGSGCGPLACDELLYITQMRDAGAARYADCIGIHYNEGIISPSLTAGDPRDAYYTRYFFGMINTYWATFGKPLCFTEIGYLSPEGYGALPAAFAWAQDTSVGEQAAWLAEAAVLASQSAKVRLMIIFNVDFTVYGADPQAGYAIIRPGGGCPACDALAAVRP